MTTIVAEVGDMGSRRSNGEGTFYIQAPTEQRPYRRGVWRTEVGGKRVTTVGHKGESRSALRERHRGRLEEFRGVPRPARGTLADWIETWLEVHCDDVAPRTLAYYRERLALLLPHLGHLALTRLTDVELSRALRQIKRPASRLKAYQVLRIALGVAHRTGRVRANVCSQIKPPKAPPRVVEPPTAAEVAQILAALRGHRDEALIVTAMATGVRQGELVGLRWMDLEIEHGEDALSTHPPQVVGRHDGHADLHGRHLPDAARSPVERPGDRDGDGGSVLPGGAGVLRSGRFAGAGHGPGGLAGRSARIHVRGQLDRSRTYVGAKRGSERVVALPPRALTAIETHRQRVGLARGHMPEVGDGTAGRDRRGDHEVVGRRDTTGRGEGMGAATRRPGGLSGMRHVGSQQPQRLDDARGAVPPESDYIWRDSKGDPMLGWEVRRRWQAACRRAGVTERSFHSIRHLANTTLIAAGMPPDMVRAVIGHRNAVMTARYTHSTDEARSLATEIMERALGG